MTDARETIRGKGMKRATLVVLGALLLANTSQGQIPVGPILSFMSPTESMAADLVRANAIKRAAVARGDKREAERQETYMQVLLANLEAELNGPRVKAEQERRMQEFFRTAERFAQEHAGEKK